MNELLYREDAQGFLLRLSHGGAYWTNPYACTQQDYLCLKALCDYHLDGAGMQEIKNAVAEPSSRIIALPGARKAALTRLRAEHRLLVLDALRKGCLVPDRVLDDYPEFREVSVQEQEGANTQVLLYEEAITLDADDMVVFHAFREALGVCSILYQDQVDPFPEPRLLLQKPSLNLEVRSAWQNLAVLYRQICSRSATITPLSLIATRLIENEISHLSRWFQEHGYDEVHIPQAPTIDHDAPHDRPRGWFLNRRAIVFGQIGCCGIEHPEAGRVSVFLDVSGYAIAYWHAAYLWPRSLRWSHEMTEAVWAIAREISKITDWAVAFEQSRRVRRSILAKLRLLVERHQGQLEKDFVDRFQLD